MWSMLMVCFWVISPASAQADQVFLARVQDGVVEVALPAEVSGWADLSWERQGEGMDPHWISRMDAQSAQGVQVGDSMRLHRIKDGRSSGHCKVVSFVTRSWGLDDFGDRESAIPTCGTAQVYAQLDCGRDASMYLAVPEGSRIAAYSPVSERGRSLDSAAREALVTPQVKAEIIKASQGHYLGGEALKKESRKVSLANHRGLHVIDVHWYSGKAEAECGGGDFTQRKWSLWDGQALVGPIRTWLPRPTAIFTVGSKQLVLRSAGFEGMVIEDLQGERVYQSHDGFCGCAC